MGFNENWTLKKSGRIQIEISESKLEKIESKEKLYDFERKN